MNSFHFDSSNSEFPNISAVILDLDGTLLNTEQATKGVLGELLARYGKVMDRPKEDQRLGMAFTESAMGVIKDYELPLTVDGFRQEIMPMYQEKWKHAEALPGANRLIQHLYKHEVPFALASNSIRKNIDSKISHHKGWREYFSVILGSDQVKLGKPAPDLFVEAAKRMAVDAAECFVIEDSLIGVKAAKAAGMKVVAVPSLQNSTEYSVADSVLHSLLEFRPELWGLPPFEDWVDDALPIEPFDVKGWYRNGLLYLSADVEGSALPDQVFGLYFGWAKFGTHEIFKVVTTIGWDHGCCTCKRKIKIHLLDARNEHMCDQQVQVSLVGYIRALNNEENGASDIEIPEEDKSIARVSLDLPVFGHHSRSLFFPEASLEDDSAASDGE